MSFIKFLGFYYGKSMSLSKKSRDFTKGQLLPGEKLISQAYTFLTDSRMVYLGSAPKTPHQDFSLLNKKLPVPKNIEKSL